MIHVITNEKDGGKLLEKTVREKIQTQESLQAMIQDKMRVSGCNDLRAKERLELALSCIGKWNARPRAYEVSFKLRQI